MYDAPKGSISCSQVVHTGLKLAALLGCRSSKPLRGSSVFHRSSYFRPDKWLASFRAFSLSISCLISRSKRLKYSQGY